MPYKVIPISEDILENANTCNNFGFMGHKNQYMENNFTVIQRKNCLDLSIWFWIHSARYHLPSLSVADCAKSYLTANKIDEGELSIHKISQTFNRIQKELFDEQKTK